MQYVDDLSDFRRYPDSANCYLDGRYFNKVFDRYPGLVRSPFHIYLRVANDKNTYYKFDKNLEAVDHRYPGLIRVVIHTDKSKHSNLLIVDYQNRRVFRFEPCGEKNPHFDDINYILEKYFNEYQTFDIYSAQVPPLPVKLHSRCIEGGFCVAYVVKYAYDYLTGRLESRPFDGSDIRKFAYKVEATYGPLDPSNPDVEYGFLDEPANRNALIGGLGGAAIGGLAAGGTGALIGGLGGGLLGYGLSQPGGPFGS